MKHKIITTKDGSFTLYVEALDEHYHSIHGAVNEANHVFIENGLKKVAKEKNDISIFEMGFGTGLNVLVTKKFADENNLKIHYTAIEKHPVSKAIFKQLNYAHQLDNETLKGFFEGIHSSEWGKIVDVSSNFTIEKIEADITTYTLPSSFDLIYFDAFGPRAQGEMWSIGIFKKLYETLNNNGIFVTYCAKGQVRRDLEAVGFNVERLPGPPGKREMLRGTKEMK